MTGHGAKWAPANGKASVELSFKLEDFHDLLKSMVVQDLDGGQVSTVTFMCS